jgi:hypothetical protein
MADLPEMPRGRGRPTKLTDSVIAKLVLFISAGNPYKIACAAVGVGYSTFAGWMAAAESGDPEYQDFLEHITHAQAEAAQRLLAKVEGAADDDWRAAAWILERRFPEHFAKVRPDFSAPKVPQQHLHLHILQSLKERGMISEADLAQIDADIIARYSEVPRVVDNGE